MEVDALGGCERYLINLPGKLQKRFPYVLNGQVGPNHFLIQCINN